MLGDIQQQLEQRFAYLASTRSELKYPVYALEHGLSDDILTTLKVMASHSIRYQPPSPSHWLVWAVLGAEAGYGYSGDEFWPAMDVRAGEWRSNEYRQLLRGFYWRFQRTYGGPVPTGRWADQFSIIAWPISHAILPRYLQTLFAQYLYEMRYDVLHRAHGSGVGVGDFLFQSYNGSSSRFRDFLQQTTLTEQIVLALREENIKSVVPRIHQTVLERIVDDLECQPLAKAYLNDARRVIQSTGLRVSSRLQSATHPSSTSSEVDTVAQLRLRFAGRRQNDGSFVLGILLPDVLTAVKQKPLIRKAFDGARIRFFGEVERPGPASVLLTLSDSERRLDAIPSANTPIFIIESGATDLRDFLEPLSRIEERPCWVLRRQSDGLFREVIGACVRSGQEYIILSRFDIPEELLRASGGENVSVDTTGLNGYYLNTAHGFADAQIAALRAQNIGTITGVNIDPVGLFPTPGHAGRPPQWLSTEPVVLRLTADFAAKKFLVSLDGEAAQEIVNSDAETFVLFDHLEPGSHSVSISVLAANGFTPKSESFIFETITPRPWMAAMREKAGFRLTMEPGNATFEQVTTRDATINLIGPTGRSVQWSFDTYNAAGHFDQNLVVGNTKVGTSVTSLASMLQKARSQHADAIDEAYRIDLVAKIDELGRQGLSFSHDVEPLRWKLNPVSGMARLIDETDHEEAVSVHEYPLDRPMESHEVLAERALEGVIIKPPGSLFVATYRQKSYPLFVSRPTGGIMHLSDLGLSQSFTFPPDQAHAMDKLIDCLKRWESSKAVGYLGPVRKASTVERLKLEIALLACGKEFIDTLTSDHSDQAERAQKKVGGSPGFGLRARTFHWLESFDAAQKAFEEIARTYGVESDSEWSHSALALAANPLKLRVPEDQDRTKFFAELLSRRNLLRGAFLAEARLAPSIEKQENVS